MNDIPTTIDGLLNRRVTLEQPTTGYRIAVDTVLLASAVPALAGDKILDIGCGVGGAFLSLACRVEGITGIGIEIQPELAELCRRNIARNPFAAGFECRTQDIAELPPALYGQFDHVLMNPPYHEETRHDVSADGIKRTANSEKDGDLAVWVKAAVSALKPSGTLTLIHRADRQGEILSFLQDSFGNTGVFPLLPKPGADPKRIIIRARKDGLFFVSQKPPLTLHKAQGGYSDEAEHILRHGAALGQKA